MVCRYQFACNCNVCYADPSLTLAVLSSTTRLPNVDPYNTFTLTCTATAPMGVIESKIFTWRRRSGSGGSCGSFSVVINSGIFQIVNSNVNQPVSTSVLTVTETTAAEWRYCCQASLLGVTGNDEVSVTVTGECVIPTDSKFLYFVVQVIYIYLPHFVV